MLLTADVLAKFKKANKEIKVKFGGKTYTMFAKPLTVADTIKIDEYRATLMIKEDGEKIVDPTRYAELGLFRIALLTVDEKGEPLFTVEQLKEIDNDTLEIIATAFNQAFPVEDEEVEAAAKK